MLEGLTEAEIIDSRVTITAADETVTTSILAVEKQTETTLLLVDPDAFTPFIDDSTVSIQGITADTLPASVYTSYSLLATEINLWAYDCEIDHLELFRRWGFLLRPDYAQLRPIRSSELYKNLLEEMLEARLRGLSSSRLENIASLLAGSDRIVFSSLNDTILTIDLVDNLILSQLTSYRLLPAQVVNINIVKACSAVYTSEGVYDRSSCTLVEFTDNSIYNILVSKYNNYGPNKVKVYTSAGEYIGNLILACTDDCILITTQGTSALLVSDLYIYYTSVEFISVSAQKYSTISLADVGSLSLGELINPQARVFEISTGLDSRVADQGLFLPSDIWEVSEGNRREITTQLTGHVIGSMPTYRIGDYELYIPGGTSTDIFDAVSNSNPSGYAWPTSYKLFNHFLRTKIAVITPLNILATSSLEDAIDISRSIKDASKRILVANNVPLVDFVSLPQDALEVVVNSPDIEDSLVTQSYGGIGALGATLLLSGGIDITSAEASALTQIGLLPPGSGGAYTLIPVDLKGYDTGYALVDVGYSSEEVISLIEAGYTIDLEIGSSYTRVTAEIMTNYVGSESILMVVGASYPEYTRYYDFHQNTASEWLQIGVTPGAPPSELYEDPIQVSDNLEQPQVLVPVIQSLEDNIESPSDNLPDPEEI